ncbi:MAG TPA: hypothetical protein VK689_03675 [Armatimonadota bacterium]|nr:hypothetical protein [Armatimonadota bacterium]
MSVKQEQQWITGDELGRENRRLIDASVPDEAPEFRALFERVRARNDYLYERYGKQYLESHYRKWIAISPEGEVIIRKRPGELLAASREKFGPGNACTRKLSEFPGHDFRR